MKLAFIVALRSIMPAVGLALESPDFMLITRKQLSQLKDIPAQRDF